MNQAKSQRSTEWVLVEEPVRAGIQRYASRVRRFSTATVRAPSRRPIKAVTAGTVPPADWKTTTITGSKATLIAEEMWMAERIRYATLLLRECVEFDPDLRGGVPVLRGTRFTVSQMLAELAAGRSVSEIAGAFRLDEEQMRKILESLAICLDRPVVT